MMMEKVEAGTHQTELALIIGEGISGIAGYGLYNQYNGAHSISFCWLESTRYPFDLRMNADEMKSSTMPAVNFS